MKTMNKTVLVLSVLVACALVCVSCSDDSSPIAPSGTGPGPMVPPSGWYWQNPLPQGNQLHGVSFPSAQVGVAVGARGTIARTTNAGQTWALQSSGADVQLYGVHFSSVSTGIAVGNNGTVLRTTNAGAMWEMLDAGTSVSLSDAHFVDSDVGAVVGDSGTIVHTMDGGVTWYAQPSDTNKDLFAICFTDANTGTAVGEDGVIVRTIDGGLTWDEQDSGIGDDLHGVAFYDADVGTAVGRNGTILATTDGGENWEERGPSIDLDLQSVFMFSPSRGVAAGEGGTTVWTADGWVTALVNPLDDGFLFGVTMTANNTAIAVGEAGVMRKTTDGGASWADLAPGERVSLRSVEAISENVAVAIGSDGTVLRTEDGGATWVPGASGTSNTLTDLMFGTRNSGIAVGSSGTVLRTLDGGLTWTPVSDNTLAGVNAALVAVTATPTTIQPGYQFIVGTSGTILRLDLAIFPSQWKVMNSGTSEHLYGVSFASREKGFAAGVNGILLRTEDGGNNWENVSPSLNANYCDVACIGDNRALVLNGSTAVLFTDDFGGSWAGINLGPLGAGNLRRLSFLDANVGIAVGDGGTIARTADGGNNWTVQRSGASHRLNDVSLRDPNTAFSVGEAGTILRTENGGGL